MREAANELSLTPEIVEQGLFADLKSEQRLVHFKDISAEHLLQRYNVALAQAVLYRCTGLHVTIRNEPPQRYRQLLRRVKFHRLLCEMERVGENTWRLHLDGPLSLFSATQKYGLQLALFFPAVLLCRDFEVRAELRWGPQRKPKVFLATPSDGLASHYADSGTYVPPELGMFVELFRKRVTDWDIVEETDVFPLGQRRLLGAGLSPGTQGNGTARAVRGAWLLAAFQRRAAFGATAAKRDGAVFVGGVGSIAHRGGGAGGFAGRDPSLSQHAATGRSSTTGVGSAGAVIARRPGERRGRDSNPRTPFDVVGFQDRCIRPLCHPSR